MTLSLIFINVRDNVIDKNQESNGPKINDIVSDIGSNIRLFADDTSMYLVVENPNIAAATLQSGIDKVSNWADKWHVDFSPSKSKCLLISRKSAVNPHLHST